MKFADHLPLYRQSEIYARQGVEISRSTLAGWVGAASDLLGPLVDGMRLSNAPVIPLVLVVHLSHERSGSGAKATQPSRS